MANRLASATSPYLLQHADNPVDWWEWGPEAFAEAQRRDAPVLLSVGYAACHWCHVMAHESFEDEATAAYLNEHFVSIKVDREERPGRRRGLHAGDDRDDRPGRLADDLRARPRRQPVLRRHLLPRPAAARAAVVPAGARGARRRVARPRPTRYAGWPATLRDHLGSRRLRRPGGPGADDRSTAAVGRLGRGVRRGARRASAARRSSRRRWCWSSCCGTRRAAETARPADGRRRPSRRWRAAASTTSSAAASRATRVDARLGGAALREDALRQRPAARRSTPAWGDAAGGAGRPGDRRLPAPRAAHRRGRLRLRAGRRHRGRRGQVLRLDARPAAPRCSARTTAPGRPSCFGVTATRHLRARHARRCSCAQDPDDAERRFADVRRRLLRRPRPTGSARPATTRWSPPGTGWPISGLCDAGPAARRAVVRRRRGRPPAGCCVDLHLVDGRLRRVSRDGVVGRHAGVLEDHGCVAAGFLALTQATGDAVWLERAGGAARRRARRASGPTTAASTTPPTTPRRWSPGRATPPTTPARPGCPRWCTPWRPTPR